MEKEIAQKKEKSTIFASNTAEKEFDEASFRKVFCPVCLKFPEYYIRLESNSNFSLVHKCLTREIAKDFKQLEKNSDSFIHKCFSCSEKCKNICVKCKYFVCDECAKQHNKSPYTLNMGGSEDLNDDKNSVIAMEKCQYYCNKHLLEFKFYCPICKINLCENCKNEHFHMNCPSLYSKNIEFKNISEPSNKFHKELYQIAQTLYNCYTKNSKSQMTLNILMNGNLAVNILKFIELDTVSQRKEIKNNYFEGIDEKVYLCSQHSESEIKDYYSQLINNICDGSLYDYKKLIEIINKYEGLNYLNSSIYNFYKCGLRAQNRNLINTFDIISTKIGLNDTNLILSKSLRAISFLNIKNKFTDFSLQLLKNISLKMNHKLDIELRRKVGNIISKILLKNFHSNLETIVPTKKLLALSTEAIETKYAKNTTPVKKFNGKNKSNSQSKKLKLIYQKALSMLKDEVEKELMETNKKDYKYNKTNNMNVISFKNLNNDEEELQKAILCNLFFYIKWNMGNKFNDQIHNIIHEINSLMAEELKKEENEQNGNKKGETIKSDKENIKINIPKSDSKTQINENNIDIKNENVQCPNEFLFLNELSKQIKFKDENSFEIEDIFEDEEDETLLKSSVGEFINILKKIKSTFMILPGISVQQSLNLFFEGKKKEILTGKISADNTSSIIEYSKQISLKEAKEIESFDKISKKIRSQLENDSMLLYSNMNIITEEIEKIYQFFNIKDLLAKYGIKQPLNPVLVMAKLRSIVATKNEEEIHYLILVITQIFIESKIKYLKEIEKVLEKVNLNEITKNNVTKKNIIKYFIDNINNTDNTFPIIDWDEIRKNNDFSNDKKINDLIINYVNSKSKEDYLMDLKNLIEPHCKIIDLSGKDPQNIT